MSDKSELEERVEQLEQTVTTNDADGREWSISGLISMGLSTRQAQIALGALAAGASLTAAITWATESASAQQQLGTGTIGTSDRPLEAIYVDSLNQVETVATVDEIDGGVVNRSTSITNLSGSRYVSDDDTVDPTQEDGDVVVYV